MWDDLQASPSHPQVDEATARRIAVRAQLLDGSATGVLDTVRHLGALQLDPVATVATPQHLVLFSRLGRFDTAELDRLLWEDRLLFEWHAYIWPVETLPLLRAMMRENRRATRYSHQRWRREFVREHPGFRRYVLRELEREGPLLSRELEDHVARRRGRDDHRWYGNRFTARMLEALESYGEVAVAGRRTGQRLWDLADRVWPATETVPLKAAQRALAERRYRALGVRREHGKWRAHPDAVDGPVPDRATLLSPFDRLVQNRDRAEALWGFRYRLEMYVPAANREYGYYVLPLLVGDNVAGRAEPRLDRRTNTLHLLGAWGDTSRLDDALDALAAFLGATRA
ncbi:MAG TPA: crosslink repair DNA glycosylase YcaQ family protein [Gaiellaceae bacterium]|nr:crosslink repair DNA glycosylase YcaQ family protein [Gaiellaceae bacterium]